MSETGDRNIFLYRKVHKTPTAWWLTSLNANIYPLQFVTSYHSFFKPESKIEDTEMTPIAVAPNKRKIDTLSVQEGVQGIGFDSNLKAD